MISGDVLQTVDSVQIDERREERGEEERGESQENQSQEKRGERRREKREERTRSHSGKLRSTPRDKEKHQGPLGPGPWARAQRALVLFLISWSGSKLSRMAPSSLFSLLSSPLSSLLLTLVFLTF